MRSSSEQLKALRRPETVLAALVLLLAVYAYTLYQSAQEAEQAKTENAGGVTAATQKLIIFQRNNDRAKLLDRLAQVNAEPEPEVLPTYEDALALDDLITAYSDDLGLPLTGFERIDTLKTIGEREFPAVSYSIVVRGDEQGLTGMLGLLEQFPTALVRTVEFNRPLVDEDVDQSTVPAWEMILELDIVYQ